MIFKALRVYEENEGFSHSITEISIDDLIKNELLVNIRYCALNYKDALSFSGNKGVTKKYPHSPGIDGAGIVESSSVDGFKKGDRVLVSGYDFGMNTSGALSQYAYVPAKWAVKIPENISLGDAAAMGTAAITSAIGLEKLIQNGVNSQDNRLLVTGATGAVGVFIVAMASKIGFEVTAVSGKKEQVDFLKSIGAKEVVDRSIIDTKSKKPLLKPSIDCAFDTVGGDILASLLKILKPNCSIACCGNTAGYKLDTTVFPFILRGISLLGVDSVGIDTDLKNSIWGLVFDKYLVDVSKFCSYHKIAEAPKLLELILKGESFGRKIIEI